MTANSTGPTWTSAELAEFDTLTLNLSSLNQMTRIRARVDIDKLIVRHGKEKCDAMYAHMLSKETKKAAKPLKAKP